MLLAQCQDDGRNRFAINQNIAFIDAKACLTFVSMKQSKGIITPYIEHIKSISQVACITVRHRYIYSLSDCGEVVKLNHATKKIRYRYSLDCSDDINNWAKLETTYTCIAVTSHLLILAGVIVDGESTSRCRLDIYNNRKQLLRSIPVESKAFRLNRSKIDGSLYDSNPIHTMQTITSKGLEVTLAIHYATTIHLLVAHRHRIYIAESMSLSKHSQSIIAGAVVDVERFVVFGWRSTIKSFTLNLN